MIRVALNATSLLSPFTGIAQYTYHIAKGLVESQEFDLNLFYGVGWSKQLRDKSVPGITPLKKTMKRIIPRLYFINRFLQQHKFTWGITNTIDLYHEPNFLAFKCNKPSIITVHDLSWIRYPETHPKERVCAMDKYFEPGLRRASLIITDSQFIKHELMQVFSLPENRIQAIPLGVESFFQPQSQQQTLATLQQYKLLYGEYLIAVATLEPRKNLRVVLEAYKQLAPSLRRRFPLVVVGMKGWHTTDLQKQLSPLINNGELRQIGYLPRKELAAMMAGALAMVYPSIYEGFGLPPLEAMACGVPVITSDVSSLPEVVQDAGLLVNPHDTKAITNAMQQLIDAPDIRNALAQKALARSKQFTWEKCVAQTMKSYREVS